MIPEPIVPYEPSLHQYPTWRYHATQPACIVATPEDERALGPDWHDHPVLGHLASEPPVELPEKPEEPEEPVVVAEVKKKPAKPAVKVDAKVVV